MILMSIIFLHSCEQEQEAGSPARPDAAWHKVTLQLHKEPAPQAKATSLIVEIVGWAPGTNEAVGPWIDPIVIEEPGFPLQAIEVLLPVPPCTYLVTVTATLTHDPARTFQGFLDMCSGEPTLDLSIDTL
jgi:hypothetical protein